MPNELHFKNIQFQKRPNLTEAQTVFHLVSILRMKCSPTHNNRNALLASCRSLSFHILLDEEASYALPKMCTHY
jgi:hypothetical protein